MICEFGEQILEIWLDRDVVGSGRFDNVVDDGTGLSSICGVHNHPVLPAYGKWTDGLLSAVICP